MEDFAIFKKIRDEAVYPFKSTQLSACWDLCAADGYGLVPGSIFAIPTGLTVKMPNDYVMEIYSRSGLSTKGIVVANAPGQIDADYTPGDDDPFNYEIKVILANIGKDTFNIYAGDKIAQCRFVKLDPLIVFKDEGEGKYELCEIVNKVREGGLGSTGHR